MRDPFASPALLKKWPVPGDGGAEGDAEFWNWGQSNGGVDRLRLRHAAGSLSGKMHLPMRG